GPGADERCNGLDDDCDGAVDDPGADGCTPFLRDADRDGYGLAGDTECRCGPGAPYDVKQPGDCDDGAADVQPGAAEDCDGLDDDCDSLTDEENAAGCAPHFLDADGDGWGTTAHRCLCAPAGDWRAGKPGDCNDLSAAVSPGATEACNGADDDCDGAIDEEGADGCKPYFLDHDGDAWGQTGASRCLCAADGKHSAPAGGDCNDADAAAYPGAAEACDGHDDDCDGTVDEEGAAGCAVFNLDQDRDGWGRAGATRCTCAAAAPYDVTGAGDCDDADAAAHPGAAEACDGHDDDCDGAVDEEDAAGCVPWYLDADGDGYGPAASARCLCAATPTHRARTPGDCNEDDAAVNPGATEACNGRDDDCDGAADERDAAGCVAHYVDSDGDGYGVAEGSLCLCGPSGKHTATVAGDCDDAEPAVRPGGAEACNGRDDDCDAATDEEGAAGCSTRYLDADGDGYGIAGDSKCLCAASGRYSATAAGDCDDTASAVHPGAAEVCKNGADEDCDGAIDEEGCLGCTTFRLDADGDTYGAPGPTRCLSAADGAWSATRGGDCDDAAAAVNPGAAEACNGRDDDCDAAIDEEGATGCVGYYLDQDGDHYGVSGQSRCLCAASAPWSARVGVDCLDTDASVHPGAAEGCNGRDDDCDGATDEEGATGCTLWYYDGDGDGAGAPGQARCLCAAAAPWSAIAGNDCDDAQATVNPGATEACNGRDDDCDGAADEDGATGCVVRFRDGDGDHWGVSSDSRCSCAASGAYTATVGGDCNDASAAVSPAATEACNTIDDDCDGSADEEGATGCTILYWDNDSDSYGASANSKCLCSPRDKYTAAIGGDCNDGDATVSPGAAEACNNRDDDCNGATDGQSQACSTACGSGTQSCSGGVWGACSATAPKQCTNWSSCAVESMCVTACPAAPSEACNGADDNCNGAADETFGCVRGATGIQACGLCGTQYRTCNSACGWDPWGACLGQGSCAPGERQTSSCGNCGSP
ncbi:MAG: putative metal-binding motif-containing protein, partial [Deltaproteobacteria bacterium]|nr:putative metal-binding motif-containing protein [Deltaproteobacteria bacterium]